jgi:hypothetical protein
MFLNFYENLFYSCDKKTQNFFLYLDQKLVCIFSALSAKILSLLKDAKKRCKVKIMRDINLFIIHG